MDNVESTKMLDDFHPIRLVVVSRRAHESWSEPLKLSTLKTIKG